MRYLTRHGSTDETDEAIFDGWADYPLNAQGRKEAQIAARFLSGVPVQRIVSSDIRRAKETAEIISRSVGVPVVVDIGLRPINVGKFTGQEKRGHDAEFVYYIKNPRATIPGGESQAQFHRRIEAVLAKYNHLGPPTVLVTHNSVFVVASGAHYSPDEDENQDIVKPGGVAGLTATGRFVILEGAPSN